MLVDRDDVHSAIDKAYEEIAQLQYNIAARSKVSGNPSNMDEVLAVTVRLSMYLDALKTVDLNVTVEENEIVEVITTRIYELTIDLRKWD